MDDSVLKLFSSLSHSVDIVKQHDNVRIFSHYDADGISAGVILAKTMMRAGKGFELTLFPTLNDETMNDILNCGSKCIIIADMGASYLKELDEMDADVIVLDHHKDDGYVPTRMQYANPHSFGMDGMTEGCGASVAMLFSVNFNDKNWDLVQIAFAGMTGDKQHQNGLGRVNEYLFREGNKRGFVTVTEGSLIPSGHLNSSLFLSVEPYISGISGNEEGVRALLNDAGIDASRSSADLNDAEKRKLSSLIAAKLITRGVTKDAMEETMSVDHTLRNWNMTAGMMASVMNSCGRSDAGGIAVGFGMGDKKCLSDAVVMDEKARGIIVKAAKQIDSGGLTQMPNIQFFDCSSSGFTGILCEIAMRYIGDRNKPMIGYNRADDVTKVSSRCTHSLLGKGVDLSVAMKKAGEAVGGGGGGHRIASGAWFPPGKEDEFLDVVNRIIGEQISAK